MTIEELLKEARKEQEHNYNQITISLEKEEKC